MKAKNGAFSPIYAEVYTAIYTEVERGCAAPTNAFGYGIWSHHILSVLEFGKKLAAVTGADLEIVELAALLHDYAGIKDVELEPGHHRHGAALARELLTALGYPEARTERVAACILTHRASQTLKPETLEARVLASADGLAHIAQVPSLLHLAYVRKGLGVDEGAVWVRAKLGRSYRKLMPEAKMLIGERYEAALKVLENAFQLPFVSVCGGCYTLDYDKISTAGLVGYRRCSFCPPP